MRSWRTFLFPAAKTFHTGQSLEECLWPFGRDTVVAEQPALLQEMYTCLLGNVSKKNVDMLFIVVNVCQS